MMRLLVSVKDPAEAQAAAAAGVDFIDLKDPAAGALGALPIATIRTIVQTLRGRPGAARLSATIGDHPSDALQAIVSQVAAVAATGVDLVKVGIAPGPGVAALLQALARCDAQVVPVFIADDGVPLPALQMALQEVHGAASVFPALMLDTQAKRGGSLLQRVPASDLAAFVHKVRSVGRLAGLAGALRLDDLAGLHRLAPDFAGFRSAVCQGDRTGALVPQRVLALRAALAAAASPA